MRKQPIPINNNGAVALQFTVNGQYVKLTGYGSFTDKVAIATSKAYAAKLYADYLSGNLKPMAEYKPKPLQQLEVKVLIPTLGDIFDKYIDYKAQSLEDKSLEGYKEYMAKVRTLKLSSVLISDKKNIRDTIRVNCTERVCKRLTRALESASLHFFNNELIDKHYLQGLSADLPTGIGQPQPKPFNKEQRTAILKAFSQNDRYNHWYGFVLFLLETGCRPCEAIGLIWQNVDLAKRQITLGRSTVTLGNGTKQTRDTSKNGKNRIFPMSQKLHDYLSLALKVRSLDVCNVFTNLEYRIINLNSFRRNAWQKVLSSMGINSTIYSPYSCRDTFITLALEQGVDVRTIAMLCDNSPEIIHKHYAGFTKPIQAIEFN